MDIQESVIWEKIQKKDVETFERYYKNHYKEFFLMARKYVKDEAQAEEIVNDVFLKIWEDGYGIVIESSLKSYLYRSVINRSLNFLNKSKRERLLNVDEVILPDEGYELQLIEENELKTRLYEAVEKLPDQCKKVFEMSRFDGLKQQEIADMLGISIKTVKNHITAALKHMHVAVEKYLVMALLLIKEILN